MSDNRDMPEENTPQNPVEEVANDNVETTDSATDNGVNADNSVVEEVVELSPEEQKIAELTAEVAAAKQALADQKEGALRALAEGENAKRRAETEIDKARKFALEKFAGDLLPVLDNLEQAIRFADRENEDTKPIIEGVDLTLKTFTSTVEKHGLVVLDPEGETFNPEQHQAMSMQESADLAPNTVMAVMQKGYQINGRLLRPAMVMVSKAPEAPANQVDVEA
ncbi:nucleotide exchange factor GrpE [Opacimonas viscosa]|uniref:Protein GrpE n=1 Tax=Opacimonas viscosa TaxID=2961944 RepID=A0AA41WW61_9ALTE|nr:nucleotide exchange factor GrpE [Opacimonas viscosa]MCP3427677.1 nucleotide exchange factor GrpE [Opacimonas viscosa]